MDTSMPDPIRRWLNDSYEVALDAGLDPSWHPDADGFDYLCPTCMREGDDSHRVTMSIQKMLVDLGVATGPAS